MRVLVVSTPWKGHLYAMVPFAWALRALGHDVQVAAPPGFLPEVAGTGLPAVGVGTDVDIGAIWRDVNVTPGKRTDSAEHRRTLSTVGTRMFAAVAEAMTGPLVEHVARSGTDLIVYDPVAYAGPIAARIAGIGAVRHLWGLDSPYLQRELAEPLLAPLWRRFGLAEVSQFGDVTVDPCPPSVQVPADGRRMQVRYVPFNGPSETAAWMLERPGVPRVCVTWGTTFADAAGHLSPARRAVLGLAELPVEVVVGVPPSQREALGEVPGNVRVAQPLPLQLVLPTCDVVVHVGGSGVAFTAAVQAVPQVILPAFADGPLNAKRLTAAHVAQAVSYGEASPAEIARTVMTVLGDPGYAAAARRLRDEILDQQPPAAVARDLTAGALVT